MNLHYCRVWTNEQIFYRLSHRRRDIFNVDGKSKYECNECLVFAQAHAHAHAHVIHFDHVIRRETTWPQHHQEQSTRKFRQRNLLFQFIEESN